MYEVERVAKNHEIILVPDNFRMHDTAHETLTKDSIPIRDKKSKYSYKILKIFNLDLFLQDRTLEFKKFEIEGGLIYEG